MTLLPLRCRSVRQTFYDRTMGLDSPCTEVCNYDNPLMSPVDCGERCPELNDCLLSQTQPEIVPRAAEQFLTQPISFKSEVTPPQTTPTVSCMDSLFLLDHVIYIIVITFLAITIIILAVCVCRLKEKRNRHLSSKRNISSITTRTPSLLLAPSGSKDNATRMFDISATKRVVENDVYIQTTLPKLASTHASGNYSNGTVANSNHTSTLSSGSRVITQPQSSIYNIDP